MSATPPDVDTLERDIVAARAQLARALDGLKGQLTPSRVGSDLRGLARRKSRPAYDAVFAGLRANPMPVLLIGLGSVMLLAGMWGAPRHKRLRALSAPRMYPDPSNHAEGGCHGST